MRLIVLVSHKTSQEHAYLFASNIQMDQILTLRLGFTAIVRPIDRLVWLLAQLILDNSAKTLRFCVSMNAQIINLVIKLVIDLVWQNVPISEEWHGFHNWQRGFVCWFVRIIPGEIIMMLLDRIVRQCLLGASLDNLQKTQPICVYLSVHRP